MTPKMLRKIHKACINYPEWKSNHHPEQRYRLNPEQMFPPQINLSDAWKKILTDMNVFVDDAFELLNQFQA